MQTTLATPMQLHALAAEIQTRLSSEEMTPPRGVREVRIDGETFQFPYRTYYAPSRLRQVVDSLDGQARAFGLALCTRHCDGYVREWAATELDPTAYPWARAFAVQLLGEYVVEIARVIEAKVNRSGTAPYLAFVEENSGFVATTKSRATSYWDCYYRAQYRQLSEFPSYRVATLLEAAARKPRLTHRSVDPATASTVSIG
jgi:hypothetical protein